MSYSPSSTCLDRIWLVCEAFALKLLLLSTFIGLLVSCSSKEKKLGSNQTLETQPLGDSGFVFNIRVEERMDDDGNKKTITPAELDQSINVVKARLVGMGFPAMSVMGEGDRGILLKVSGLDENEAQSIKTMLEKVSLLGLHEVHPESEVINPNGKTLAQSVFDGDVIVSGHTALREKANDPDDLDSGRVILIKRQMALSTWDISEAIPSLQSPDSVEVTLGSEGEKKMIAFTTPMRPGIDRIAVVIDGEVLSAPVVQVVPLGRHFVISGLHDLGQAKTLALTLMHPLENALFVEDITAFLPASK